MSTNHKSVDINEMFYFIQGDPCLEYLEHFLGNITDRESTDHESNNCSYPSLKDIFNDMNNKHTYSILYEDYTITTNCIPQIDYTNLKFLCENYSLKNSLTDGIEDNCFVFNYKYPFEFTELKAYILYKATGFRTYSYTQGSKEIKRIIPNEQKMTILLSNYINWKKWMINSDFESIKNSNVPPRVELYPNLKVNFNSTHSKLKFELAKKWNEISLLWYVGDKTRKILHNKGIYTLNDPRLSQELEKISSSSVYSIQKKLIQSLNADRILPEFVPNCISSDFVYFDVESESQNLKDTVMVGMLWYSIEDEKLIYRYIYDSPDKICNTFFSFITNFNLRKKTFVHYTSADLEFLTSRILELNFLDLNSWININYTLSPLVQSLRLLSFGLKHVVQQICETSIMCKNIYSMCNIQDGLTCMKALQNEKSVNNDVMIYNFTDTLSLYLLHCYASPVSVKIDERLHSLLFTGNFTDFISLGAATQDSIIKKRKRNTRDL